MKILLVGQYAPETMAWYLERNLKKMGHEVSVLCYRSIFKFSPYSLVSVFFRHTPLFNKVYLARINNKIISLVKRNKYDLVIFLKSEIVTSETLDIIKSYVPKIVNWFMDPIVEIERNMDLDAISKFDYFLVKDHFIKKRLNQIGLSNIRFLLEAYDPEIYHPVDPDNRYKCDICMVGNIYDYRLSILKSLKGYDLKVWGKLVFISKNDVKPFYQGRPAITYEKNKIFNSARIVLNTHNPSEVAGCNVRLFEICGSGAFQISDSTLYTDNVFKNESEVVYFNDVKELRELIAYYLDNDELRNKIAERGHRRALKDHTYEKRIKELFRIIKLKST
jgi:spore maturation protein CgeB